MHQELLINDTLALSHIHAEHNAVYGQTIINLLEHYAGAGDIQVWSDYRAFTRISRGEYS